MKHYRMKTFDGELVIDAQNVTITHKGIAAALNGYGGTKIIPLSALESVSFIKGLGFINGSMRFNTVGDSGCFPAKMDINTVVFKKAEEPLAIEIRDSIIEFINGKAKGLNLTEDSIAEINKYKALLDNGIITEEEFRAKKKELLGI